MSKGRSLVTRVGRRIRSVTASGEVTARLDRQHERLAAVERDLARIGPQVAALEQRLEDVAERLVRWEAGDEEMVEARALVTEMRAEHARVRERISAAARFEERLSAVEAATAEIRDAAH